MKKIIYKLSFILLVILTSNNLWAQSKNNKSPEYILSQMSENDKIREMYGVDNFLTWIFNSMIKVGLTNKSNFATSGGNKKLGIPVLRFTDGHKGITSGGKYTAFPATISRSSAFDRDLEYRVGLAISSEAEAAGASAIGGCTANLLRNPRGGRSEESYGEDSFLAGELGAAFAKGIQHTGKVMAVGKHLALYSIENNRFNVNARVDERALREVYLPHFKKMVQEGGLAGMMSSYNKINGTYASENEELLSTILRKDWGFKGFVISDWEYGTYSTAKAIKAGLNIEMPMAHYYSKDSIKQAIKNNQITWKDVDNAVLPIITQKLKYGQNKPHQLDKNVRNENQKLSQEVAEKGMVLLKNEGVLPFSATKVKNIVLVGELAKYHNLGEITYIPNVPERLRMTPYKGMKNVLKDADVNVWYTDGKNTVELERLVSRADAIVVCVGFTTIDEAENFHTSEGQPILSVVGGGDRDNLNLHPDDIALINMCSRYNKKNMAVVVFGGGTPVVNNWIDRTPALLVGGIPGMEGGNALANILFGNVNPSGKLPYSIYKDENDYPSFPNSHLQSQRPWEINEKKFQSPFDVDYDYYIGYTLAEKKNIPVSYPFGFGLSYTHFSFGTPSTSQSIYGENDDIKVNVRVTNTGQMKGGEVVQVYAGFENAKIERPNKVLKGFEKVYLNAGESKDIQISIPVKELAYWDAGSKSWEVEKIAYTLYVGNSSKAEDLQKIQVSVQ